MDMISSSNATELEEIGDLFDEIANKELGYVTSEEMHAILPYAAGAAKADVHALIDEMKVKKMMLSKKQFIRFVSRRAYSSWNAHLERLEKAPLAHVIISMKRRKHLIQFSNFYRSKGVAGAELVIPVDTEDKYKINRRAITLDKRRAREIKKNQYEHHAPLLPRENACKKVTNKARSTQQELHDQLNWSQRRNLVESCRKFKSGYQHVYAIVFNSTTRELERHGVFFTKPHVKLYSSRYFCVATAPERDHQVIASPTYVGYLYNDRKLSCHGLPPDLLLASYFLSPDRHLKVGTTSFLSGVPSFGEKNFLIEPIRMLNDARIENLSCCFGNMNFVMAGKLYEWGSGELSLSPDSPEFILNSSREKLLPECYYPTLDEVHHMDAIPYTMAPRVFHRAIHEYSMWLSRHPQGKDNQECLDRACMVWQETKIRMGPHQIHSGLTGMSKIVCGGQFYAALSQSGELYVWGKGDRIPNEISPPSTPQRIPSIKQSIRSIACGSLHVLCTDCNGIVYSWGGNIHGQLGTGLNDDIKQPEPLVFLKDKKIIDVMAGDDHSLALTDVGEVFSFGNNWYGQLGQDNPNTLSSCIPTQVSFPEELSDPIYLIRSIGVTCAAVSVTGSVFVWGLSTVLLLGLVSRYTPQLIRYETIPCSNPTSQSLGVVDNPIRVITTLAISAGCVVIGISTQGTYEELYTPEENELESAVPENRSEQ